MISLGGVSTTTVHSQETTTHFMTFTVREVRFLEPYDFDSNAFFTFSVSVNNESYGTVTWNNLPYITEPRYSVTTPITDDSVIVFIKLNLSLTDDAGTESCDLTYDSTELNDYGASTILLYDMQTGHWSGDDERGDLSGYGRLNGCDDGSIYTEENDCELLFSITQYDPDGDGIPTWMEDQVYGTNPTENDSGSDIDDDGVPIEWEWKWGYDPFVADPHNVIDPDNDSITNIEEYLVSSLGSDPFRKDIFLEIDWMEESPEGEQSVFPVLSIELLRNPFNRRNYVFHVDAGSLGGGEIIPFNDSINQNELLTIYEKYFLHDGTASWKRGIFHYGIYVYDCSPKGYGFSGDVSPYWGYHPGTNGFMIASSRMERNARLFDQTLEYYYGAATMHEMGHNFGFRHGDPPGVDVQMGKFPWQPLYYVYGNYQSIMNYRYTYKIFDYSDGSHGFLDNDDWGTLNLSYFEYG
jgi:hypothetical protein